MKPPKRGSKRDTQPPARQLAQALLYSCAELRLEIEQVLGFVDDLEDQARRVAKLRGGR